MFFLQGPSFSLTLMIFVQKKESRGWWGRQSCKAKQWHSEGVLSGYFSFSFLQPRPPTHTPHIPNSCDFTGSFNGVMCCLASGWASILRDSGRRLEDRKKKWVLSLILWFLTDTATAYKRLCSFPKPQFSIRPLPATVLSPTSLLL